MTAGSSMHAMIRTAPPQAGQVSISIPKTRFRRCAQVIAARRSAGVGSSGSAGLACCPPRPRLAGVTRRQRLQREYLTPLLRPNSDAVGDGRTQQPRHRPEFEFVIGQAAVLRVPFQQPLAFKVAADTLRHSLRQPAKLRTGRFFHPPGGLGD